MENTKTTVPKDLLAEVDEAANRLGLSRGDFVREALEARLSAHQRAGFEARLADGYQDMRDVLAGSIADLGPAQVIDESWVWDQP